MAASDQQLLWEGLGLQEAAASYREGRLAECRDSLLAVQLQGFSRVRWYVESNLLACRLQVLLRDGGGGCGLQALLHSYQQLWQRMRGVPSSCEGLAAELSVLLSLCQLLVILHRWSLVHGYEATAVDRVNQALCPQPRAVTLSSLQDLLSSSSSCGEGAGRCVGKMSVLCALVEGKEAFSQSLSAHCKWLGGCLAESNYRQAWLHYRHGDYNKALTILSLSQQPPPPSPLSPLCALLAGACYAKQGKPTLAVLHWKRCMEVGHTPGYTHFLSALQNCAVVYSESSNPTASAAVRKLELEALHCPASSAGPTLPVWVWLDDELGVVATPPAHRSLAEAAYCLAWHALQSKSYRVANEVLGECITAIENGDATATLPPPSSLHLLRARLALCCGDGDNVRSVKMKCEQLIQSPSTCPLWRSEVMCILATAALHLGETATSRHWSLKCLEAVEKELGDGTDDCRPSRLQLLQHHVVLLLALVAITHARWREALQLLGVVVATPTGLYNHCLLQCRVGVVLGGASGWVEARKGRVPGGRSEARQWLEEARAQLSRHQDSGAEDRGGQLVAMDTAMLGLWLQHSR